jgi:hypothetical protein
MKISKLIETLQEAQKVTGDVEVMMQSTFLSNDGDKVFDSTVETVMGTVYKDETVLKLYWQC